MAFFFLVNPKLNSNESTLFHVKISLNAKRVQCLRWVSELKKDWRFGIAWKEGEKRKIKKRWLKCFSVF